MIIQEPDIDTFRSTVRNKLQNDASMFAQLLVTNLKFLDPELSISYTPKLNNADQTFVRFKLACRSFLDAIASPLHPVVLCLDDLQFSAEVASLKVIESIMTDPESKNMLLLATYCDGQEYMSRLNETIKLVDAESIKAKQSKVF